MKKEILYLCAAVVAAGCLLFVTAAGSTAAVVKTSKTVSNAASTITMPAASPVHATPGTAFPGIIYIEM